MESVTPVPKSFPAEKLKDLRKISGLLNFSKVTDKIIGGYLIEDMSPTRKLSQYGREKGVSALHYLIKMLHKLHTAIDRNSKVEAMSVILNMVDWSQAFDRLSHRSGIESFIENGVRPSLIPQQRTHSQWRGTPRGSNVYFRIFVTNQKQQRLY